MLSKMFIKRLRQLFTRRKNKKSFSKSKYVSPPPSVYKKSVEMPLDPEHTFRTPRMTSFSIEDNSHLFENQFELSRIPTFQMRSSGWQSSKPYSQNATRFRFHGSYNRFRSSRCSSQGSHQRFRSSRCSNQGFLSSNCSSQGGITKCTTRIATPKTQTYDFQTTPRPRTYRRPPHYTRHQTEKQQNFDFSN